MSDRGSILVVGNYGTLFGVPNTAMGSLSADKKVDKLSLAQGVTSSTLGLADMMSVSERILTPAGLLVGGAGMYLAGKSIWTSFEKTGTVKLSDVLSLAGNTGLVVFTATEMTPAGAAVVTGLAVGEFGVKVYEIGSKTNGMDVGFLKDFLFPHTPTDISLMGDDLPAVVVTSPPWEVTLRESVTNWTDARSLASVYQKLEYNDLAQFAKDLAIYAPDNVDALDAWFGGWQAGNDGVSSGVASNGTGSGVGTVNTGIGGSTSGNGSYDPIDTGYDPGSSYDYNAGIDDGFDYSFDYGFDYGYDYGGMWPVVIDLDGDGVEINPLTNSLTAFDADGDGYVERTAWVGADDGLLMIDLNNDGKITDPKEIAFANLTPGEDTDLQALASTFDSNGDGVLDARDERFSEFRVWHDANSDGRIDSGELISLADAGILSLSVTVTPGTGVDLGDGSVVHGTFDIQRSDGKRVQGADVKFSYESQGMREERDANGNLVFRLESGDLLKQRVFGSGDADFILDAKEWIGATGNAEANHLDASAATWSVALDGGAGDDVLNGGSGNDWLIGGEGADVLDSGSGDDVLLADADDVNAVAQKGGINGGAGRDLLLVTGNVSLTIDADAFKLEAVRTGGGDDSIRGSTDSINYVFDGGAGNDRLSGVGGNDLLAGGEGNDQISAGAGNDQLIGGAGNDLLSGGSGDDLLSGGSGDDRLEGGAGDDVYLLNRGDGADRILDYAEGEYQQKYTYQKEVSYNEQYSYYERVQRGSGKNATWVNELRTGYRALSRMEDRVGYRTVHGEIDGGIDTLQFGAGITIHDIVLECIGDDMRVSLRSAGDEDSISGDSVTIEGWADTRNRIENFGFANGNLLDFSQIENAQHGMAGADRLIGTDVGDFLSGGSGDDILSGKAGNDVISGGSGNDVIDGGDGEDLLFSGSGNDSLNGGEGDDYLIGEVGNDRLDGGAGDDVLAGMDGDDALAGGAGNDRLLGGAGNDLLLGGAGDDTYFYFRGDGHDEIFDDAGLDEVAKFQPSGAPGYQRTSLASNWVSQYRAASGSAQLEGGNDSLQFGQGVAVEDLYLQTLGDDLIVSLREAGDAPPADAVDQITIRQWSNAKNRIETFGFIDGRSLQMSGIAHAVSGLAAGDDLTGSANGDLLSGGAGNDKLSGMAGADYLIGGAGDDQLSGGDGNDDLYGGSGSDHIDGSSGNDYLYGGDGKDAIDGGDGNDVLVGGAGDDLLNGGRGNDVYQFNRGDGQDTIDEAALGTELQQVAYTYTESVLKTIGSGKGAYQAWVNETRTGYRSELRTVEGGDDTIQFGSHIDISDVLLERIGDDLRISLLPEADGDAQDSVTVKGWSTPQYRIEHLRFINDFAVDIGQLDDARSGTAGDDLLNAGADRATWLGGAAGNDTLTGSSAADVLNGGEGDDALNGGMGDDVYIFVRGDGKDTLTDTGSSVVGTDLSHPGGDKLLFGAGITIEDLVFSRNGKDMIVYVRNRDNPEAAVADIADSVTIKSWDTTANRVEVFQFFDGRDFDMSQLSNTVLGRSGEQSADQLTGLAGSDWMDGFGGEDTLRAGAGNDYLLGGGGNDKLYGEAGSDLMSGGSGDDLLSGGDGDDIAVGGDGNDTINGEAGKDFIVGGAGDDIINGGDGDDVIIGDAGNDTYTASAGTDVYRFGFGDGNDTYIGSEKAGVSGTDIIELEANVSKEQLWFERAGDDLVMKLLGSSDSMTFKGWYLSDDPAKNWNAPNDPKRYVYGIEAGGELLCNSKVNGLVAAMAGFTPNDGSSAYGVSASELPSNVRAAINSAWAAVA